VLTACGKVEQKQPARPNISVPHAGARVADQDRTHYLADSACPLNTPQFADYPTDTVYNGRTARVPDSLSLFGASPPNNNNVSATLARGPNFAGHYTVVDTRLGTEAEQQTIMDATTGRIVARMVTALGADFRLDSRLLIANPLDSTGCFDPICRWCRPVYYQWNGLRLDSIW